MIRIRISAASPFARKCRIAAAHCNLLDRVSFIDAQDDPADAMRRTNPLAKVPVALLEDGSSLYDSPVILEYLDHLAGGGRILPTDPARRFPALRRQALADGIMDAAILIGYEARYREPHQYSTRWLDHQRTKVERGLQEASADLPDQSVDVGSITLACALGFLDLRHEGAWRATHGALAGWLAGFAARVPSFEATRAAQ
jgi:glutathione S-transferase